MPTYGYECELCHAELEVMQRITDEPLTVHEGCGGALRRKLYPVGIVFKGPGFHVNDYGPKRNGKDGDKAPAKPPVEPASKPEAKPAETKPTATTAAS